MSEAEATIIGIVVGVLPLVIVLLVMQIRKYRPDFPSFNQEVGREEDIEFMVEKGDIKGLIKSLSRFGKMSTRECSTLRRTAARRIREISVREPDKITSTSTAEKVLVKTLQNEDRGLRLEVTGILENIGWEPSNNKEELRFLGAKEDILKLEKLGRPAVRELMSIVERYPTTTKFPRSKRYQDATSVTMRAIESLANIGDPIATKTVLDVFGYDSFVTKERVKSVVESLARLGKSDATTLCAFLQDDGLDYAYGRQILWALCESGNTRAAGVALDVVSKDSSSLYTDSSNHVISVADFIRSAIPDQSLRKMFGDYTELVFDSVAWKLDGLYDESQLSYSWVKFDSSPCLAAVVELCALKTPVSSNLLNRAKDRKSLTISNIGTVEGYVHTANRRYLDFTEIAELAKAELVRRGNPKYDRSAYSVEGAWKIRR